MLKAKKVAALVVLLICCFEDLSFAQSPGIYNTSADFDNGNISFTRRERARYKFRPYSLFNNKYIKIIIGDSVFKLCKDSVFAYRNNDHVTYRLFKGKEYRIINPNESIKLYSSLKLISSKGNQTSTEYFFSAGTGSAILPLTKINLKRAFPDQSGFHELIDIYFDNDAELIEYDSFYKIYKINRIFQLNSKEK